MKKLRFAVIGTGFWSNFQVAAWKELEGVEMVAVCNRTLKRAEEIAVKFGVQTVYTNAETLLENEALDFVDIITDVGTHAHFTMLAANKRVDVICQKPMAPSLMEAQQMVEYCTKRNVQFFIHENFRWQGSIKNYPEIVFLGKYDDKANVETAAKITADLLAANPDLAGLGGFDSNSGPGMALSVKEANKVGKVKITTVDAEPEHLRLVKEGVIDYLVGQKRELLPRWVHNFYYMRDKTTPLSANDARAGVVPIPSIVITGSIEIDKRNVDLFLQQTTAPK